MLFTLRRKIIYGVKQSYQLSSQLRRLVKTSTDSDGIFYVSISRPEKRNAVDVETGNQLHDAIIEFNESKDAKIGIFHSSGTDFCAGFDLKQLSSFGGRGDNEIRELLQRRGPMGPTRLHLTKPVIGAIAGHAVAGGFELALLCDMRILEEDAVFGVFCRRYGVPLIDGGTVRLQKLIGLSRALDLILTGREVSAVEAYQIGLANRIVPKGKSLEEAKKLAKQILKFPQACMLADRKSTYHAAYDASSMDSALKFEYENGMSVIRKESIPGAGKFVSRKGKPAKFE